MWVSTVAGEFFPKWWGLKIEGNVWKQYWEDDKAKREAESEQRKKDNAARKTERKRVWKSGTANEKAKDFFLDNLMQTKCPLYRKTISQ
ncbi:hypothetical protein FACS189472_06460 [Alphaproteobacteria bacterium]|nr:hypothetical protein FACS189472_06460 [Alphaproteobacteria bacterium]